MNMNLADPSNFTFVLFFIKLVLLLAIRFFRSTKQKGQLRPGPRGWPVIGNLVHISLNRHTSWWLHRVMENMKTEIACFRFARVHVITVTSSEIAREVVRDRDEAFADRVESYSSNLISEGYKDVVFSFYGERWKLMKKMMVAKLMSPKMLNNSLSDRTLEADNIVAYVFNLCQLGSTYTKVNVRDITGIYCHAVMMIMIFGRRHFEEVVTESGNGLGLGREEKEHMDAIYKSLDSFFSFNVTDYIPCLRGWNLNGKEAEVREAVDIINKCNDPIIHERMQLWRERGGKETEEDWLDILITLKDDQGMSLFTFDEIRAQCKDINVAAIDNTMNNVEWTIAEMLNHPEILEKATNELDTVVGKDRLVQESDISQLNYIKACSRESFRLHPVSPFMPPHRAREDTTLAGYFVPKGSHILVSRLGLGQNPKIWDEPDVFKPERHLDGHGGNSINVSLMEPDMRLVTFGTGRRGCIGSKIGTSMTIMLLARLLQGFEWSHLPGTSKVDLFPADPNSFTAKSLVASVKPRLAQRMYPKVQRK
ncbi:PREDICTED: dihomomethionine N-hydroxylase-like [Camelina sativa]|uniref:Dihomomethionine N-hydroxylase-like n=1 Tax=Camelina sativa TaxID=90675 RepID=A0ABM0ZM45_CAMSA|nr:PREDICTED: dihomomethionine N-hydroxylase-like [Camelina sativa]